MGAIEKGRLAQDAVDDEVLVGMARSGDPDAFGELVRRHRGTVYGWAKSIVSDPHLAEDVVQEAIMKSFLRLGTLADMRRFLPWLHRIVRNQALRTVRRGGRFAKELPVSDFAPVDQSGEMGGTEHVWPVMTPSAMKASLEADPCELLLRHEVMTTILAMVGRLSPAERAVFEAHVFQELTAQEIAGLLEISTASVYMSISRSRKKLQTERLRTHLTPHGGKELSMASTRRAVLAKPAILHSRVGLYNESIRNCIYYALPYVGKGHLGYDEVMALTGHAFQINIEKRKIKLPGVYMYAGTTMYPNSMLNLGLNSSLIDKFGYETMPDGPKKEELYHYTLDMIRGSIDRGVPAIFGSAANTQFALYYGYDDSREVFYAIDTLTEMEAPYSTFRNHHLYGFGIEEAANVNEQEGFRRMLAMAVKHGRGEEETFSGIVNGLMAYDSWISAFENRTVDAVGNAASLRNVGDMRGYAASYLRRIQHEWESKTVSNPEMSSLLSEAAASYGIVAEAFRHLKTLFPFPDGGEPARDDAADAAILLLRQAREAEKTGLDALEKMLAPINGGRPAPRLIEPSPFWVF